MKLRENIKKIIEPRNENKYSKVYDLIMLIAIVIGILPLMFRTQTKLFWYFDLISGICFIVDYILRWSTADFQFQEKELDGFCGVSFYTDGSY